MNIARQQTINRNAEQGLGRFLNAPKRFLALLPTIFFTGAWCAEGQAPSLDDFNPGVNGVVYALAVQADGKILVGGNFISLGGQPRTNLARLNADGSVDASFNAPTDGRVLALAVQEDGRILVGGTFSQLAGRPRNNLARVYADGLVDTSFVGRTDGEVWALGLQKDGKVVVGGKFTTLDNEWSYGIGRLKTDGTKDSGFSLSAATTYVFTVAVQPDGKVLMGGSFGRQINGLWRYRIARWNANGTLDEAFNPGEFSHNSASVDALAVQADGRILVGGTFTNLAGRACYRIARLNPYGGFDTSFGSGANDRVNAFALQADGTIIVAGNFTTMSGQPRSRLARLHADGTLDDSFNPGCGGQVYGIALEGEGKLLTTGDFTNLVSQLRTNLARLNATAPATRSLSYSGGNIAWLRGGTSPEVWRTVFDYSTNGADWTGLGAGTRIAGGWQVTNVSAPANATLRARGFPTGGEGNGSGGMVEDFFGPPLFIAQPANQTNNAGTTASFNVRTGGSEPVSLQWRWNGAALTDIGKLTGTATTTLTISNAQKADEGAYSIVITNSFGSVTSVVAALTVLDPGITTQPISQNRELGQSATLTVTPAGTAPFSFQWWKDGFVLSQATNATLSFSNLLASDAGRYTVVVSNGLGSVTSAVAVLTVNAAAVDGSFNTGTGNNTVYAMALQPDGKILAGGTFSSLGGQSRSRIARLNADGSADVGFNPGASGIVFSLAVQEDRRILVGGDFGYLGGMPRDYLGRLNQDGTLDTGFNSSPNGRVFALSLQADNSILLGGTFTTVADQPRTNLARLNPDGTLDTSFNPGANSTVSTLLVQPDGMILVGGYFKVLGGQPRTNLARLFPDGTVDDTFTPTATSEDGDYSFVSALALQRDGRILAGGHFSTFGRQLRINLARLNADGTLDTGFNPGASHDQAWMIPAVDSLSVQTDGKILVAGIFTTLAGQPRSYIGRLNEDGSLDPTFNPVVGGPNPALYLRAVVVQPDGKILVGGSFAALGGQACTNLARLNNTAPASDSMSRGPSAITWLRGGSSPEVWRTVFDYTSDGVTWARVGEGTRIPDGWQLDGAALPAGGTLRARGFLAGAYRSASSWFVEKLIGAPVILAHPSNQTANAGSTVTFTVLPDGEGPLAFQWLKNGLPLANDAGVSGDLSSTLTLTNVLKASEGDYRLVVTNASGSVTSLVAALRVIDPVILASPVSRYGEPGQSATFTVTAAGTILNYQWWKDGALMPQATGASLTLTNLQLSDAGGYRVVVSNQHGSLISSVATLTVNLATLDTAFNPGAGGTVSALALQTDGKIVLGGLFSTLGGQTRLRLGRLNANGSLDTSFNSQASATVYSLALQPDGKILVGGDFTSLSGFSRRAIGRLNTNGTLDTGFNPTLITPPPNYTMTARAQAIVVQSDGKIVVGGQYQFTPPVGPLWPTMGFVLRLNTNGTSDGGFTTTGGANGPVTSLALQPDGKILTGGQFTTLRGQSRNRLGRLNAEGTLDTNFTAGADNIVLTLAAQADDKILVGGAFNTVASQPRTNLARLNPDGTVDADFAPAVRGGNASVYSLALQTDGKILLGGLFTTVAGQTRANCARLNADGTLDTGFNPQPNNLVYGLVIQPDGWILAGGDFTQISGQARSRIARLKPSEPAMERLNYDGAILTWLRGGSSSEVWRTSFEFSTNLTTWSLLGAGTRIAGGWELNGLGLLPNGRIRARGHVAGGAFNASGWFLEKSLDVDPFAPPVILVDDDSFGFRTNRFGFNLTALIGQTVLVEASTNLQNWQPLQTNTLDGAQFYFTDPESSNAPSRFYRARLLP